MNSLPRTDFYPFLFVCWYSFHHQRFLPHGNFEEEDHSHQHDQQNETMLDYLEEELTKLEYLNFNFSMSGYKSSAPMFECSDGYHTRLH